MTIINDKITSTYGFNPECFLFFILAYINIDVVILALGTNDLQFTYNFNSQIFKYFSFIKSISLGP